MISNKGIFLRNSSHILLIWRYKLHNAHMNELGNIAATQNFYNVRLYEIFQTNREKS